MPGTAIEIYDPRQRRYYDFVVRRWIREWRMRKLVTFPFDRAPASEWNAHGFKCWTYLNHLGHITGYVEVPMSHMFAGRLYTECVIGCGEEWCRHTPEALIDVHGGITFSARSEDGWVFGFDTAHYGDFVPGLAFGSSEGRQWEVEDVEAETTRMAEQLVIIDRQYRQSLRQSLLSTGGA